MAKLVALNPQHHKHLRVAPEKIEEQAADLHMLPVVTSEFLKLVVNFPILFSKNAETGEFVSVCLMGFEKGENLFWKGGEFHTLYTPLNIARHPFFVGQDDLSGDNYVVCIDEDSPMLSELHSESLFNSQGQPSEFLENAQNTLAALIDGQQQTQAYIHHLLGLNLLVPLSLDITFEKGESKSVKGLYSIDEEKLAALSAEQLASLRDKGYLSLIYTQLASLGQIYQLIDLKNRKQGETSPWFKASGE